MKALQRSYLLLHISIVLWGFTAILGALISLSSTVMVWWRVGITGCLLFIWPGVRKGLKILSRQDTIRFTWIGILVGLHWVAFFASVKYANASTALITMSLTALFTALLEPFLLRSKLERYDIGLSILVIPAMLLITDGFEGEMRLGFWLGVLAAFLLAYFTVLNRKYITRAGPITITFIEMTTAWLFLSLLLPFLFYCWPETRMLPSTPDVIYLLILAIGCTILPFALHLEALKHITAFATNLIINLEPVYGLVLAALILKEYQELGQQFYLGAGLLLIIVFTYPFVKKKKGLVHMGKEKTN